MGLLKETEQNSVISICFWASMKLMTTYIYKYICTHMLCILKMCHLTKKFLQHLCFVFVPVLQLLVSRKPFFFFILKFWKERLFAVISEPNFWQKVDEYTNLPIINLINPEFEYLVIPKWYVYMSQCDTNHIYIYIASGFVEGHPISETTPSMWPWHIFSKLMVVK